MPIINAPHSNIVENVMNIDNANIVNAVYCCCPVSGEDVVLVVTSDISVYSYKHNTIGSDVDHTY